MSTTDALILLAVGISGCGVEFAGKTYPAPANEGVATVQPGEPIVWPTPCTVSSGTRFTASLDRPLGTDMNQPGDAFTAHVVTPVASSCGFAVIASGSVLRGRVTRAEPGSPPILALELIDVDTSVGPKQIPAAIRSGAGLTWVETNSPNARSSYEAFVLNPSRTMALTSPRDRNVQLTLPGGSRLELELTEPVVILP